MTRSFISEFYDRRIEVERYLAAIRLMNRVLSVRNDKRELQFKIFKAGALLVLYNAIEASARSAIQAIYDEIGEVGAKFDDLNDDFRRRVLHDFRKRPDKVVSTIAGDIAAEIVQGSFDVEAVFAGNVDAREIKRKAKTFGFSTDVDKIRTRDGSHLLTVKNKRNDLAHGVSTFSEVGREYTVEQIREIAIYSLAYMEEILLNIERYLDEMGYVAPRELHQASEDSIPHEPA